MNFCEFDKYAIKSYCAIHNVDESLNLGNITKVDETKLNDFNMMTWGFPCTSISVAGKRQGFVDENGNQTASGLYYEGIRILKHNKPSVSIIENVKNLTGKKFKNEFKTVLNDLEDAGYNSYWKVLNAKDYGVPQNRERVYIISIRKDLDNKKFKFPEPFSSTIRLKDILEKEVDEKFYIPKDRVDRFVTNSNSKKCLMYDVSQSKREGKSREYNDYSPTLTSRDYKDPRIVNENALKQVAQIYPNSGNPQAGRIYDANGISPAMDTCQGGNRMPKVFEDRELRIRKLTPKECFRLMGFSDENFDAAQKVGISNSQLYKQAGNSIVVDVLYYIYKELYIAMPYLFDNLKLSSFFSGIGAFEIALDRLYQDVNSGNFTKSQMD